MKLKPSKKQMNYARGRTNPTKTKYQVAIEAGFSPSTARVPQLIENKIGFSLAMAQLAGEAGNAVMKAYHELNRRDLSQEDTKTILYSIDTLSKAFERFIPKEPKEEKPNRLREVLLDFHSKKAAK